MSMASTDTGTDIASELANVAPTRQLDKFSRMMQVSEAKSKVAFRNLPKLCSFWLNGTCTRVLRKTCPFRPCCGIYMFPEIAGGGAESKKLSDNLIEMLNKDGPAAVQKKIDPETKNAIQQVSYNVCMHARKSSRYISSTSTSTCKLFFEEEITLRKLFPFHAGVEGKQR